MLLLNNEENNSITNAFTIPWLPFDGTACVDDASTASLQEVEFFQYNVSTVGQILPVQIDENQNFIEPNSQLFILVHGFRNSVNSIFPKSTVEALFGVGRRTNIVAVNWSAKASESYNSAASYVADVGIKIADFLIKIVSKRKIDASYLHLIGFSLGGHVVGIAGKAFYSALGHKVARITALDPAGPVFRNATIGERLHCSDADFVQAFITSKIYGCPNTHDLALQAVFYNNFSYGFSDPVGIYSHRIAIFFFNNTMKRPVKAVLATSWRSFMDPSIEKKYFSVGYYCQPWVKGKLFIFATDIAKPVNTVENGSYMRECFCNYIGFE